MHKLLERQLRRYVVAVGTVPDALRPFLQAVEEAYCQADDDRQLLEHCMEVLSDEHRERFNQLQRSLADTRQSSALLQSTLDSTTDGILVVDRAGRIVLANRKFADMWRIPADVLASGDDAQVMESVIGQLENPEAFSGKVRELYAQPEAESTDLLCFKDGRRFERHSVPHRLDGQPIGRLWGFRDVTGRQQLEDQLRQSQKMDAIGKLAGGVAHDFNNLITVMKMHAELLAEDLDATDARLDDVRQIAEAANRAAGLTRQLLAFSRKQVLHPEVLDVNEIVGGIQDMLRRLIGEDIALRTALPAVGPRVLADRGQIEQVLLNLAVNARDAMVAGGVLTFSTATVRLDEEYGASHGAEVPVGEYALITVSDTGCGIPKDIRDRIFEPFFTTKELGRGTGLGLSTVYGIVKQSNGFIWVYSEVGHGSTFKVYLPLAAASSAPGVTHVAEPCLGGTETVLLAEDEDAVRALAQRVLEKHGYRVLPARNGQDALRIAAAHGPGIDVLVTDVVMPELGGADLAERLRASIPTVAVVFMSGYTEDDIVRRGLVASDVSFVEKPFTARALVAAVRRALERAQPELAHVGVAFTGRAVLRAPRAPCAPRCRG